MGQYKAMAVGSLVAKLVVEVRMEVGIKMVIWREEGFFLPLFMQNGFRGGSWVEFTTSKGPPADNQGLTTFCVEYHIKFHRVTGGNCFSPR